MQIVIHTTGHKCFIIVLVLNMFLFFSGWVVDESFFKFCIHVSSGALKI